MRTVLLAVCACLIATAALAADNVSVSKMALVTMDGSVDIAASPAKVWSTLTDADKIQSWCPMWKEPPKGGASLASLGNAVSFTDDYGNPGKSVVVYVDAMKELRIAHVPDNGSYVCQVKFNLEGKGNTTTVKVTEQYSDDMNVPLDKDTALQTKTEIAKYLANLKTEAEKK
ncbi:MAG TPA: SRPBCC domain-containing protein [Candidatus Krumholzibacteria bacterium]|nr:SRPBCC domain-containing protein [Candidatus Krumholzibacteria bacterium]